ncbi:hypothetical protein OZ411_28545 [Bradyrhizobium sp. Arg237L]|uniref:hypothetical protein n=1 Tax=Bradyrhizobium sp. Arg237L TaxID=3003352 RepID=UPI00249DC233|nr:hypothetical protein [Bradyrhizobium sp. Arg237L]MDI4236766.1 hypothetical protein [Bradyrhizobium sp. Arg237L]
MRLAVIVMSFALSVQSMAAAAPDASGDALDAGLLDDTRLGGPVLTSPPPSEPVTTVRTVPPPAAPVRPLSANPLWGIPLTQLSNTRERPVFSPSRRPPPVAVAEPVVTRQPPPPRKKEAEPPQLSLVGTIAGDDEGFGIFLDQSTNAALRLRVGEDFQGWKLSAIRGREVTMEKDEQGAVLTLPPPGGEGGGEVHLVPVSTIRTPLVTRR